MKIKEARLKAGLTQQAMAEKFEIPKRTIENWETGSRKCPGYVEKLLLEKLEEMRMRKLEIVNGHYFLKGDFVEDIESDDENKVGIHLINCDIIDYDEDGVYFDIEDSSEVYLLEFDGQREYLLERK